jgi:hypothetical protein
MRKFNLFGNGNSEGHNDSNEEEPSDTNGREQSIIEVFDYQYLLKFLQRNFETYGYDTGLSLADDNVKVMEIEDLTQQLMIIIEQVKTFYEYQISEVGPEIDKMSKLAMDDSVQKLKAQQQTFENHLAKVKELESDAKSGEKLPSRIRNAYEIGYCKGIKASSKFNIN